MNKRTTNLSIDEINAKICAKFAIPESDNFSPASVIEDAFEIIDIIRNSGNYCCITISSDYNFRWSVSFVESELYQSKHKVTVSVDSSSLPLAICNAALQLTYTQKRKRKKL